MPSLAQMVTEPNLPDLEPSGFPVMLAIGRRSAAKESSFRAGLDSLGAGLAAGAMRKVAHDDLKYVFGRAIEEAWEATVSSLHFHAGRYESQPKEVQELYYSVSLMSVHDVLAAKKKVDKTKCTGEAVKAMRLLLTEAHVLAVAMAGLKDSLIKGRAAPSEEQRARAAALANPDKLVMTCSCCFRQIAMAGETMAHHGYKRPGFGSQTASCMGIRFRPLEVSSEGLECILKYEREQLERLTKAYAKRNRMQSITRLKHRKLVEIRRDDPHWEQELRSYVDELESELRFTRSSVKGLQRRLDSWVKTQPDGLCSVRKTHLAK